MSRLKAQHQRIYDDLQEKRKSADTRPITLVPRDRYANPTERRYAAQLDLEMKLGVIRFYAYQGMVFPIARGAKYTPDFIVWLPDDVIEVREVKGELREAARVRHLSCRQHYPQFTWRMLEWKNGTWQERKV